MIKITMFGSKWRLLIENEEWEFPNKREMLDCLEDLAEYKDNFGRLKEQLK